MLRVGWNGMERRRVFEESRCPNERLASVKCKFFQVRVGWDWRV